MRKVLALLAWMVLSPVVADPMVTEVVPLGFRTLEEIVPVLRPLVPAPGTLTGMQNRLVIRTTPENLDEIKAVLASLDRPPRRLLISVKQDRLENQRGYGAKITGSYSAGDVTISSGRRHSAGPGLEVDSQDEDGHRVGVSLHQHTFRKSDTGMQQVQTLEGREAYIRTGTSVPVRERSIAAGPGGAARQETVRFRNITSGFYAVPRVNGDRVTLEIRPHSMRLTSGESGIVDVQEADTVVSGRLGEWIQVGAATSETDRRGSGITYSTNRTGESRGVILVKVDMLP